MPLTDSSLPRTLEAGRTLPLDAAAALLVGRVWLPEGPGQPGGPAVVALRGDRLVDISAAASTLSALLAHEDPSALARSASGRDLGPLQHWLDATCSGSPTAGGARLLAPNDLQVVKAAGVTFVDSMVERVIEEQARGDASRAEALREQVTRAVGDNLAAVRPGSPQAMQLKALLVEQKLWSQYLEVGIGPDAEVFTKAAPLASLGTGVEVGLHPGSTWNNPEPEVVLAVSPRGQVVGAALGNDVNLRDFEGRSALLLGKAKDNNGSCAIGPFIRLFDGDFGLDDVRQCDIALRVEGEDGFLLEGSSSMSRISRDPLELVGHAMGPHHQYPDGMMLFCGTMFAPIQDRDAPGAGFTHHVGDRVEVGSARLGMLVNWVDRSDRIEPWTFGIRALMANLASRGLAG
ncbi:MAG: fumarylacetoacetate hydrolase [Comamonadaceae bacterium]|nr:MAG: fumarylacetoacetate hydrolase [Comamonadaceae bacterium]